MGFFQKKVHYIDFTGEAFEEMMAKPIEPDFASVFGGNDVVVKMNTKAPSITIEEDEEIISRPLSIEEAEQIMYPPMEIGYLK